MRLVTVFLAIGAAWLSNARQPPIPDVIARYVVRVADLQARVAEVTAAFDQAPATISMDDIQADHLPDGWATFVEELRATDGAGTPIPLRPAGRARWTLSHQGPVRISYRVNLRFVDERWPPGNEQAGIRTENAIYLVTRSLFAAADRAGTSEVRFDVPRPWRVSSPWRPADEAARVFHTDSREDLQRNIVVLGEHAEMTSQAGPLRLILVLPGRAAEAAKIVEPAFGAIAASHIALFPSTPADRFMMAVVYADRDDGEAFNRSSGFTVNDDISPASPLLWANTLAHEMLHYWNGRQIQGSEPRGRWAWFREGGTEYLANLAIFRSGVVDEEALMKKLERHAGNYAYFVSSPAFERMSLADAGRDSGRFRFGVYDGGWTAALCLDGLIREGSGGRSSFDTLVRRLYEDFALRGRRYTTSDLIGLSTELATRSTRTFFDRHVLGIEPLPIRECFARVGLKAVVKDYAAEVFVTREVSRLGWP